MKLGLKLHAVDIKYEIYFDIEIRKMFYNFRNAPIADNSLPEIS